MSEYRGTIIMGCTLSELPRFCKTKDARNASDCSPIDSRIGSSKQSTQAPTFHNHTSTITATMADMEVDPPETSNDKGKKDSGKKRFEVKKVRKHSAWAPMHASH
jgi:hypothetical protein